MKKILILALMLLGFKDSFSQRLRVIESLSIGYGYDKKIAAPSMMYNQSLVMGKKVNFAVGTGLRLTSFFATGRNYEGIETKNEAVSFRPYPRANTNALNIPLILEVRTGKVLIGANFDIVGIAFGKRRDSLIVKNNSKLVLDSLSAGPSFYNLGLGKKGTTNNEVYIGFRPQEELTIKVGFCLLFSEYSTRYRKNRKDVDFGSFRYETPLMPFISVVFNFER